MVGSRSPIEFSSERPGRPLIHTGCHRGAALYARFGVTQAQFRQGVAVGVMPESPTDEPTLAGFDELAEGRERAAAEPLGQ
ncbi:MAG: hypothetical protein L3J96_02315 [Thermoplasmata archaeon]|nr:hypothetical protein [Thermoplasmata archaeon]